MVGLFGSFIQFAAALSSTASSCSESTQLAGVSGCSSVKWRSVTPAVRAHKAIELAG